MYSWSKGVNVLLLVRFLLLILSLSGFRHNLVIFNYCSFPSASRRSWLPCPAGSSLVPFFQHLLPVVEVCAQLFPFTSLNFCPQMLLQAIGYPVSDLDTDLWRFSIYFIYEDFQFIYYTLCYFPTIKEDGHYVALEDTQLCFAKEVVISPVDRKQLDNFSVGFSFNPVFCVVLSSSGGCNNAAKVQEGFNVLNFMTTSCQLSSGNLHSIPLSPRKIHLFIGVQDMNLVSQAVSLQQSIHRHLHFS